MVRVPPSGHGGWTSRKSSGTPQQGRCARGDLGQAEDHRARGREALHIAIKESSISRLYIYSYNVYMYYNVYYV